VEVAADAARAEPDARWRAELLLDLGDAARMPALLTEAEGAIGRLRERTLADPLWIRLATARAKGGAFDAATATAERAASSEAKAEALFNVAKLDAAAEGSGAALPRALAIASERWRDQALIEVLRKMLAEQHFDEAKAAAGRCHGEERRAEAQALVAAANWDAGRVKQAKEIDARLEGFWRGEAQAAEARSLYRRGREKDAFRVLRGIDSPVIAARAHLELGVLTHQLHRDRPELLDKALAIAGGVSDAVVRANAYEAVALGLAKAGELARAKEVADKASGESAARALVEIAAGHAVRGDVEPIRRMLPALDREPTFAAEARLDLVRAILHGRALADLSAALQAVAEVPLAELRFPVAAQAAALGTAAGIAPNEATRAALVRLLSPAAR
jgi:hypothetical protein